MYQHSKKRENLTALSDLVQGFMQDPSVLFQAEMEKITQNMQSLPFYRQDIECYCPKFVLFDNQWVGSVLTPWMMSLVVLPGPQQIWEEREIGDKIALQLPYSAFTFTVSQLENIPQYLSCSLSSPLDSQLSNAQAKQITQDCLRILLSIPVQQKMPNEKRRDMFRAMLKI